MDEGRRLKKEYEEWKIRAAKYGAPRWIHYKSKAVIDVADRHDVSFQMLQTIIAMENPCAHYLPERLDHIRDEESEYAAEIDEIVTQLEMIHLRDKYPGFVIDEKVMAVMRALDKDVDFRGHEDAFAYWECYNEIQGRYDFAYSQILAFIGEKSVAVDVCRRVFEFITP